MTLLYFIFLRSWTTSKRTDLVPPRKTSASSRKVPRSTSHRYPAATSPRAASRIPPTVEPTQTQRPLSPTTYTINRLRTIIHRRQTPPILISLPPPAPPTPRKHRINIPTNSISIRRTIIIRWPLPHQRSAQPHQPDPVRLSWPTIRRRRRRFAIRSNRPHWLEVRKRRRLPHRRITTIKRVAVNHRRHSTPFTVDTVLRKRQRLPPILRLALASSVTRTDTAPNGRSDT